MISTKIIKNRRESCRLVQVISLKDSMDYQNASTQRLIRRRTFYQSKNCSPGEDAVNTFNREHCNYLKEDLSKILQNHPELAGKQDFVVLLGGSMYLPDEAIIGIMKMAKVLLRPGGKMVIDYLILTNSMRRVGVQGWPVNPANMQISQSLNDACDRADKIIEAVNSDFQSPSDKELAETYAHVNTFEPWGDQSVMFEYELY